jgi:putative tricarboxylic transport membrane protein
MLTRLLMPTPIAVAALAATAIVFAVGGWQLGFWNSDGPGPGLLPFAAAIILLPLLVFVLREPVPDEQPLRATPLAAVVLSLVYAAVLPHTGFIIATVIYLTLWVRLFHQQGLVRAATLSVCLTAAGTFLFAYLLRVPMPLWPYSS